MADQVIAGRYRLQRRLGGGGMSEVWSAIDVDLDRQVAVKLLGPRADPVRFRREARAVAALAHPNICRLYAYGETAGRPFMVLEYLPGGSLEERLAGGRPLPDEEAARIAAGVAAGLAHAHGRGVVHRDLKPANILFDAQGRPKIADFGIARIGRESGLTEAGTVFGTAAYISPEQAAGEHATPASDVYAFGVVLFRMLTGRLPFEGEDGMAVAAMHRERPPPSVTSLRPDAPSRLESIAAAALAKSPFDRPRDGAALLAELAGVPRPAAETAATHVVRPARGRRRAAPVLLAAAILATAGVALAIAVTVGSGTSTDSTSTSLPTTPAPAATSLPVVRAPVTTALPAAAPTVEETTVRETTASVRATTSPPATTASVPPIPPTTAPATEPAPARAAPPQTTVLPPPTVPPATSAQATTVPATSTVPPATTAVLPPPPPPPATTTEALPAATATATETSPATTAVTTTGTSPATTAVTTPAGTSPATTAPAPPNEPG